MKRAFTHQIINAEYNKISVLNTNQVLKEKK